MDALMNSKIGGRIKKIRKLRNLTQEKLAEQADLSASYISRVENGDCVASLDSLCNIASALQVGIESFLCDLFATIPEDETIKEINIAASALPLQKRRLALHYLHYLAQAELDL